MKQVFVLVILFVAVILACVGDSRGQCERWVQTNGPFGGGSILFVAIDPVTGFTWAFPTRTAGIAIAIALAIGLLASVLPARRAARLDPVEGLVDE